MLQGLRRWRAEARRHCRSRDGARKPCDLRLRLQCRARPLRIIMQMHGAKAQQTAELRAPLGSVYFRSVSPSLPASRESGVDEKNGWIICVDE